MVRQFQVSQIFIHYHHNYFTCIPAVFVIFKQILSFLFAVSGSAEIPKDQARFASTPKKVYSILIFQCCARPSQRPVSVSIQNMRRKQKTAGTSHFHNFVGLSLLYTYTFSRRQFLLPAFYRFTVLLACFSAHLQIPVTGFLILHILQR